MRPPRRVAVFTGHFHPHVGGVERFSLELWRRMAARGWDVRLMTSNTHGAAESERVEGIHVVRLPVFKVVSNRLPVLLPSGALWRAVRALREWSPDVMVTNTRFFSTSVLGVALAERWGVPCLHIDHGSDHIRVGSAVADRVSEMIDHTIGSWVVRRATRCVGVSGAVARFVEHLGRSGAGVLYNGVDTTAFSTGDGGYRARLGLASDDFLLLFVGRLIEDKGVMHLLDAMDRLNGATRAQLVIAGDGPLMPAIRARTAGCANVHLLGFVSPAEVGRLMCACDVFVHPSNYPEGLPTSVLEAGAAGRAIVATPMGGTAEIVPTPAHGLIVPPADPARLAEAISRLERDGELRASLGRMVREHVQKTFDWERIADAAEAELNGLIRSAAGERR